MKNSTDTKKSIDIEIDAWRQLGELSCETHLVVMWAMLDTTYRPRGLVKS